MKPRWGQAPCALEDLNKTLRNTHNFSKSKASLIAIYAMHCNLCIDFTN